MRVLNRTDPPPKNPARKALRQLSAYGACILLLAGLGAPSTADAHDGSNTTIYGIVSSGDSFSPSGSNDESSNGKKVHLSSPRHSDSGNRGELSVGRQENENGRGFN